jgi:hypothetical protein
MGNRQGKNSQPTPRPDDPSTFLYFKTIEGTPLSKHKKFREMSLRELAEYSKQSEAARIEARDMLEREYHWWLEHCETYVMIAGNYGSFTTKFYTEYVQKQYALGNDPFDAATFYEFCEKTSFKGCSRAIRILKIILFTLYVWWTLDNL